MLTAGKITASPRGRSGWSVVVVSGRSRLWSVDRTRAITGGMEGHHLGQLKRHAQLRHQPRSTPLWVGDPADWELVRARPRPSLVYPEPGCDMELISYENQANRYNPRIFKFKATGSGCDH